MRAEARTYRVVLSVGVFRSVYNRDRRSPAGMTTRKTHNRKR
jgi:hypothetical protein